MNESSIEQDKAKNETPVIRMTSGNTSYLLGIHFSDKSGETVEDKVKKLIQQDVKHGNF